MWYDCHHWRPIQLLNVSKNKPQQEAIYKLHTPLAVLINESDHPFRRLTSQPENMEITSLEDTQPAFTCSKLTIETLEQGAKYVQS